MIARLSQQLNIDRKHIYATGMSNGAMMSYRLACEMSDVFSAIAPVAGTDNTRECKPAKPVAVLHIHAKNDTHVLFNGGAGKPFRDKEQLVNDFVSVPDTIAKWTKLNNCSGQSRRALETQGAYCEAYSGCRPGAEVALCVTEDGGHSWPGGNKRRGGGNSTAISANDVMWDFFRRQ
jgi:polyhydroxybutyrate depolymerase